MDTKKLVDTVIPENGEWIAENENPDTAEERIQAVLALLMRYGQTDGAHHKDWCIDQTVRLLTGDDYELLINRYCGEPDSYGERDYSWDEGIAP